MTAITTTRPTTAQSLKQAIIRHPLIAYFLLAFAGFWGVQLPVLLSQDRFGLLPYTVPLLPFMLPFVRLCQHSVQSSRCLTCKGYPDR